MGKIKLKLNEKSDKKFLTTRSGYVITKENETLVDDNDAEIQTILHNRKDIEMHPVKEINKRENVKIVDDVKKVKTIKENKKTKKTKKKSSKKKTKKKKTKKDEGK